MGRKRIRHGLGPQGRYDRLRGRKHLPHPDRGGFERAPQGRGERGHRRAGQTARRGRGGLCRRIGRQPDRRGAQGLLHAPPHAVLVQVAARVPYRQRAAAHGDRQADALQAAPGVRLNRITKKGLWFWRTPIRKYQKHINLDG